MQIVISILTITFLAICGLGAATPPSYSLGQQPVVLPAAKGQPPDAFSGQLQNTRARRTSSRILLSPQSSRIRPRLMNLAWGGRPVLSIPVAVTNSSAGTININLAHELNGGIQTYTDLYVAARPSDGKGEFWSDAPGYQVGDSADRPVTLTPGETKTFDIRLNWVMLGTGSVGSAPLIDVSKPGKYSIKFLMFFKAGGSEEYVESKAVEIEVEK